MAFRNMSPIIFIINLSGFVFRSLLKMHHLFTQRAGLIFSTYQVAFIHNSDVTVGYSYIYGPWTDDEIFGRISRSIDENGFRYCRVLTDCNLTREMQILAHRDLAESLRRLKLIDRYGTPTGKVFHQLKVHGDSAEASNLWSEGQCYLQAYNVFWDTTGHEEQGYSSCFACDSVTVLTDSVDDGKVNVSERRFDHSRWGTVNNLEVSRVIHGTTAKVLRSSGCL